jgi:hypothetical protein
MTTGKTATLNPNQNGNEKASVSQWPKQDGVKSLEKVAKGLEGWIS